MLKDYLQKVKAASAGTFILLSGHVAAMSPGSTCGAAMPIMLQPIEGEASPADEKTINFLAGHMRSIAWERNRPADVAERFVNYEHVIPFVGFTVPLVYRRGSHG
jgi:membrane-bound serine protease (ClpP class)